MHYMKIILQKLERKLKMNIELFSETFRIIIVIRFTNISCNMIIIIIDGKRSFEVAPKINAFDI
jgi:uncharacterized protein with WD repeat